MKRYHKLMSFFSYLFGIVSLIAVIINDKKDKLYSFFIWQAFLLNITLAVAYVIYSMFYLSNKILTIPIDLRVSFSLKATLIPMGIIIVLLLIFGIMSYKEIKFNVPIIGRLAGKITNFEVE